MTVDRIVILGIDPGLHGAIAAIDAASGELAWVEDMPVVDGEVSGVLILDAVAQHAPDLVARVCIEEVAAFPKNGSIGNFKLGLGYGVLLGVAAGRWPLTRVRPLVWKRGVGVSADKTRSRKRAIDLWPGHADVFRRVKDDGRAEAALIGRWAWERGMERLIEKVRAS